ncbi:Uncharacterised protein [Escherichia coli]|nr:Uncharacterised protein [Escherichia coli]CTZ98037.1 Uncharacterised protein [Escherichia coli]
MTPGRREDKCPSARAGKRPRAGGAERGRAYAPPLSLRGRSAVGFCFFMPVICLLLMMLLFLLLLPTVLLFSAALITVCFVVLLLMPFPGVPLAGRAVVNGASEAVSALAGFHP